MPLAVLPAGWAWPVMIGVVLISIAGIAWAATSLLGTHWIWFPMIGFVLLLSRPALGAILVGSQGPLVGALVGVAWIVGLQDDWLLPGLSLGLAATLKLFPALLVPMLWMQGRRRIATMGAATWAALNAAGLVLPGVTVRGSIASLVQQPNTGVANNLSPELPGLAVAVAVIALVVASRWWSFSSVMAIGSVAMLILTPVLWNHYLLVLAMPIAWITHQAIEAWPVSWRIAQLHRKPPSGPTGEHRRPSRSNDRLPRATSRQTSPNAPSSK